MAEKIGPKGIPAAKLKHGDIIEIGGERFLVCVRHKPTGDGLDREIAIQNEGSASEEWTVLTADHEVRWVSQTNLPLAEYQLRIRTAKTATTPTKQKKRWWW